MDRSKKKRLSARDELLVIHLLSGMSEPDAMRKAGFGPSYSLSAGRVMKQPLIQEAFAKGRAELRRKAHYDVQNAADEIDKAIAFSYAKAAPMSVAKLLESKSKLYGLILDRTRKTVS